MEALVLIDNDDLSQTKIQRGQQKLLLKALLSLKSKDDRRSLILQTRQLLDRFENRIGPTTVLVWAVQRHQSHQPTDHRPITVQNFRDALLTQIGDPLSVKTAKVDAEHNTWARPATGYIWRRAIRQNSVFDGLWRYYYRTFKIKKVY